MKKQDLIKFTDKDILQYTTSYSDGDFNEKIKKCAKKAGKDIVRKALTLYEVLKTTDTPSAQKVLIIGALGYLILPVDIIPDILLGLGFVDDLCALIFVSAKVKQNITPTIEKNVQKKIETLFHEN